MKYLLGNNQSSKTTLFNAMDNDTKITLTCIKTFVIYFTNSLTVNL